ncbi:MAG TPA: dihydroorotase [Fimbriimonadaceae bacterium]|nr:dihydroorotase [Fimbriimonadaceae bacterium]
MPAEFDLLVQGGTVVSSLGRTAADVGVRAGRIEEVGDLSGAEAEKTIDARGLHVLPGVIDTQVHFREPGLTHKEDIAHGSLAAAMGGVTTYFEMPNTDPPTTTEEALEQKLDIAKRTSYANYAFFIGASRENVDELRALEALPGTPGVKIFAGSSTGTLLVDDEELLEQVLRNGARPCPVHSEDEERLRERKKLIDDDPDVRKHPYFRDAEAARLSTERLIRLCEKTRRPVHILHVSTLDELPLLKDAKKRGLPITCEVTPQHLYYDASAYETLGSRVQMNPPIRAEEHRMALWNALEEGLFDVFGSDHAPHTIEEKEKPYPQSPSGMPGVQTMLPVLLNWCTSGRLTVEKVVKMACERPADLYGVKNKGRIAAGYDADLAIVDLSGSFTIDKSWLKSKCGWSPFEGVELTGRPVHTVVSGTVVVEDSAPTEMKSGRMVQFTWKS